MSRIAIYPGTFGPVHLGHQDILEQASKVFDRVVVVIGKNHEKNNRYTTLARANMWEAVGVYSMDILPAQDGECVLDWAKATGATQVVRGVRDGSDVLGEQVYRKFVTGVSLGSLGCTYFMSPPLLQHISSSAVRQILALKSRAALNGWLDPEVTSICLE